ACLTQGDSEQLLTFLQDEKNQIMGCVLIGPLIKDVLKNGKSLDHCQAAITHLITTCSPNELLHSLLELIEDIAPGVISETILVLIPHLQTVLLQLEEGKAAGVGSALSALQKQLSRLPVPYTRQQEEADQYGVCRCCHALAAFTKPFIEEVKRKNGNYITNSEDEELRTELLKFCMWSLREPLLEAELNRDRKSALWLFATEIMVILPAIHESLSELLFFNSVKKSPQTDSSQSTESRACLAYLLFVQLISIDSFPAIFSPVFVLQCNMEYINQLLSSKAIALQFYSIYNFCRCMLKTSNHAGVESYIVKNIRSQVEFSMQPGNANRWFLGEELLSLLRLVFYLPQGAQTDLLNSMDRIMETLNLLRYLLIRDKELKNAWEELYRIKDEYLKVLRVCISISRGYYCAELKALREDQKLKVQQATNKCCYVSQVLQSALVTFDLMESLIVRVEEITEEKVKTPSQTTLSTSDEPLSPCSEN
uniref:Glomulin, FKBP associated protein b n=1 Tax=Labrus bergylta TaxID=56723 RepID=A0A3Q3H1A1_9LABR